MLGDHLGSTIFVTHDGGTPLTNQRYYAFGKVRLAGSLPTDHWFTGQKYNSGNGLYYYGARYYDPELGRFIQPDTIVPNPGDVQSFDRYAYALNNPLKYTDPTGHTPEIDSGTGGSLPPNIQNLYTAFYLQFKEHPISLLYDGDWALFAQDFVAATDAAGAAGLVEYGAVAEQMANTLAGRGKAATGGLMSTGDALRFFLYGLDNDFQQIVAQKENERVGQLMGVLGMSFMFSSALGGPCSFANDTLVATVDGLKPITQVKVGDLIYAYNEATGEVGLYQVTAELAHLDREIVTLVINGERIVTTPEHPFYTTANGWTPAGALQVGDAIRRANGSVGIVQTITVAERPQVMYNLTVADAHTFFVGDGQWLVHNQCFRGPAAKGFDWEHIFERHSSTGAIAQQRTTGTVFEALSPNQIQAQVKAAWGNRELMETQVDLVSGISRMRYQGVDPVSGQRVEMWYNSSTRIVETAYPIR